MPEHRRHRDRPGTLTKRLAAYPERERADLELAMLRAEHLTVPAGPLMPFPTPVIRQPRRR